MCVTPHDRLCRVARARLSLACHVMYSPAGAHGSMHHPPSWCPGPSLASFRLTRATRAYLVYPHPLTPGLLFPCPPRHCPATTQAALLRANLMKNDFVQKSRGAGGGVRSGGGDDDPRGGGPGGRRGAGGDMWGEFGEFGEGARGGTRRGDGPGGRRGAAARASTAVDAAW